jgi:hypothetical protein
MFSRREHVDCATCHTVVPRLTRFGYDYRRAGFRIPDNLGKDEKPFELGDFFSARIQASVEVNHIDPGGVSGMVAPSDTQFSLTFNEFTMYPLTGSWGRWFSSMTELSFAPEDFWEIENAYVRFNYGKPDSFAHARFGVVHPFEGYGASDRPVGLTRPLIQRVPADFNQDTFFTTWGFDQMVFEVGYTYYGLSATATVSNGIVIEQRDTELEAFPAQGGELSKPFGSSAANRKDLQLFLNLLVGDLYALSAQYYHGWDNLPKDPTMAPIGANAWLNSFDRVALYAYAQQWRHLGFQGGGQLGVDDFFDPVTGSTSGTFVSGGFFVEVLLPVPPRGMGALRYDYFDPASKKDNDLIQAATATFNWYTYLGLQGILEYQFTNAERGPMSNDRQVHSVQLRMIFIM